VVTVDCWWLNVSWVRLFPSLRVKTKSTANTDATSNVLATVIAAVGNYG
jgi:hypothetical protein